MHSWFYQTHRFWLPLSVGILVMLSPILADASGVGGVRVVTSTVSKIVDLLTGD